MDYFEAPYQHFDTGPPVFMTQNLTNFPYGQPTGNAPRSKTPASLVNHTGHSPGPLSTPPPPSRNASQGPEQLPEHPEQMVYDDAYGNLSDSPISAKTPDDFEVDMLESPMLDFYPTHNADMTTQVSQSGLPALETNMMLNPPGPFSDQVLQEAYNASLASESQQYQVQFTMQTRPLPNTLQSPPYSSYFGQNYRNQLLRQDPWSGEGPPRNSAVPRSGMAMFDPVTDPTPPPIDYSYESAVNYWTMNNTDPNYLLSPSDPGAPPSELLSTQNHFFNQQQQPPQQQRQMFVQSQSQQPMQNSSPIEMKLTTPSPTPDANNFVNYTSSSALITSNYTTNGAPPTLVPSIEQWPTTPLTAASSPVSSDALFPSYQRSEPGSTHGRSLEPLDTQFLPPPSPVRSSPNRSIPEVTIDISPEPEQPQPQPVRRSGAKAAGRPGGRTLGTHLPAKVAKAAHDMRKTVACWHCVLQRDKCGPGDICDRCQKRSQRPNADCGLGCSRIKLIELAQYFLPSLVMQIHEDTHLTHFVTQFIHQWNNQEITVYMTCSQKKMPRIPVKVYEFAPRGKELLEQIQYQTDKRTQQRVAQKKVSPALGMVHINHNEEKKYDKYINDIVDNHLAAFTEICWADDDNDFAPRLFKLMTRVKPETEDEQKLLREVYRLVVCTFIMSHTLTIAEETKIQTLSKMHSFTHAGAYAQNFTSPRMTNRQLKYFFARIQRSITNAVLNKLQQIFKSSKGCDKWVSAFLAVTGMALAYEDQQKTVHQVMQTRAMTEGWDQRDAQAQANIANREIDARMNFISQIFRWKYNRKVNPLRDAYLDWDQEIGFGNESSILFVRQVAQLVKENIDYLQYRQNVSISSSNQSKYTARLVGQFLLSFWLPQ